MDTAQAPFIIGTEGQFNVTRLVDAKDIFHNSISIKNALSMAADEGLDLVCFADAESDSPLCKLIDYGRWRYVQDKKKKKLQKEQRHVDKEIRFTPLIGEHDINHKVRQVRQFIENNCDVTITMRMKRRDNRNEARQRLNDILKKCADFSSVVSRKDTNNALQVRISKKKQKGETP